jgi:hypothetical protein
MGNDYKLEFNDYSGKPVYILPDGSRVEHEELDDFYYKDSKTALTINDYAETYINKGRRNEPLTDADVDILKTKLNQSIDNPGSVNSLIVDPMISGLNFKEAITDEKLSNLKKQYPNENDDEIKKRAVVEEITEHLKEVHKQGQSEYNSKQNTEGEEDVEFYESFTDVGDIPIGGGYYYSWDQGSYVRFTPSGEKIAGSRIKNAQEANRFFKNIKFKS